MKKSSLVGRILLAGILGGVVFCQAQESTDQCCSDIDANKVVQPHQTYVYAAQAGANNGIGSISQFRLMSDGTLSPLSPPSVLTAGESNAFAGSMVMNPSGTYLYEENLDPLTVTKYCVTTKGTLSVCSTLNFEFSSMAFTHDARIVVAASQYSIGSYRVSVNGALSLINSVPATWAGGILVVDPTGRFVYVANESLSTISEYSLSATGVIAPLTPTNTVATGWLPFDIAFSPKGILYSVNYGVGTIGEFSMDTATGALTPVNTFLTGTTGRFGAQPRWISFDPTGSFAFVGNVEENTISQFLVDAATGGLTRNGPDMPTSLAPLQVVVDPSGKFAFSADGDGEIMQFIINKDGTLAPNGSVLIGNIYSGFPFGIMFAQQGWSANSPSR